ncbi:multi-pass transmembrane [Cryptosporidium xiaoi]|uniref:Multi-pass transmembrane n=1 Tax=Cryptosporidium xiaoi TaxID=659607 RepID=A0AAV9XV29_9CRYT
MATIIRLLLLFAVNVLLVNGEVKEGNYCLSFYYKKDEEKHLPYDNRYEFLACKEHERRTCCNKNHSEAISKLFGILGTKTSLSSDCHYYYQKLICSYCDGEVGNGNKLSQRSPIICSDYCEYWYYSCKADYFDNSHNSYVFNNEEIPFIRFSFAPCSDHSVTCSPLHLITADPVEFCQLNGFAVNSDTVHSDEYNHECFNGVTSASFFGPGTKKSSKYKKTIYKTKRHVPKSFIDNIKKTYSDFIKDINIPVPALVFITLIIIWTANQIVALILRFYDDIATN